MAQRPIFISSKAKNRLVDEISIEIRWHSGFAPIQKQRNIEELHRAAELMGYSPILEVSTKSFEEVGKRLSAFNLKTPFKARALPIEVAFQGSKVFELGGPFTDLYELEPREAKRDERLRCSGRLRAFNFGDLRFSLTPVTAFYDWLYLKAIYPHRKWLERLNSYAGFSDIEFNPEKSVNCQARSCALFLSLESKGLLDEALASPQSFSQMLISYGYMTELPAEHLRHMRTSEKERQGSLELI